MSEISYIDTRPGKSCFSAPKGEPDYLAWLNNKYEKLHYKDGKNICCVGLTQKIHELIQREYPPKIVVLGKDGGSFAKFIMLKAKELDKSLDVEVISGN